MKQGKRIRGNRSDRYGQGRGVRKEKNACTVWAHVNSHSCTHTFTQTHTGLLHLLRVQTEEQKKR